jgi:hypothetical protein
MRFERFLTAASRGLIFQIPGLGPVIEEIMKEMDREQRLVYETRLIKEIHSGSGTILEKLIERFPLALAEFVLSSVQRFAARPDAPKDSPLTNQQQQSPQIRRFVYLASENYAKAEATSDIAIKYRFLWRSYYANVKDANRMQRISNVCEVRENDIIVLGYRHSGGFRILLPLVVQAPSSNLHNTKPIPHQVSRMGEKSGINQCPLDHSPFVYANSGFTTVLEREGYGSDPRLGYQTGLNVLPLRVDLAAEENSHVFSQTFPNPGNNSLWKYNHIKIDERLTHWIGLL